MAMSAEQNAAFNAATGHSVIDFNILLASILMVLVFIFVAWVSVRSLSAVQQGQVHIMSMLWLGLRASALIAISIWLVN